MSAPAERMEVPTDADTVTYANADLTETIKVFPRYGVRLLTPGTAINALLMCLASMAGPVFDEKTGTLSLCSLVRVHESIREWMSALISAASVLQIAEVRIMAAEMAKVFGAESAESGHPDNGRRPVPDELAEIVANLIAPVGRQPCRWLQEEFEEVVNDYMQPPACLLATTGGVSFTAEFPFGEGSSLFRGTGRQGLLPNFYYAAASRAYQMSNLLKDAGWDQFQQGLR